MIIDITRLIGLESQVTLRTKRCVSRGKNHIPPLRKPRDFLFQRYEKAHMNIRQICLNLIILNFVIDSIKKPI